jgi:hypothetical protein
MDPVALRDPDEARLFLFQGLWLQRILPPSPASVRAPLEWSLEIAASGQPLPPVGFVADLGHVAFGLDWQARTGRDDRLVPGVPPTLLRAYEDHVLGKLYTDWTFAEAGEYLRTYEGRDRARGLAFVLDEFRKRAGFAGVELSPGIIKAALEDAPEEALARAWESLDREGLQPRLGELLHALVTAVRRTAEVLGPEDLFELKRRTALEPLGQRVALRQVLQAAARFEAALPRTRPRPPAERREVPTRILDEDTYPVGGFASLSNRGTVESLLHSQLGYMEGERPDLFDIKYLRDELLYYSRDENQFLRRRRTFAFALFPDLVHARFKDAALPYQRVILLLALLLVLVRRLSDWLSTDALKFVFIFLGDGSATSPLDAEWALLRTLLQEQIENGTVELVGLATAEGAADQCTLFARRSLCHCLAIATAKTPFEAADTQVARVSIAGARPVLADAGATPATVETAEPLDAWQAALHQLLRDWIW